MKIRIQFIVNMLLFGFILTVITVSLILTMQKVDALTQQEETARSIERTARELSYLSNDYLLHREMQQHDRWELKFASLSDDLEHLHFDDPNQQVLVDQIRVNHTRLKSVFTDIVTTLENAGQTRDPADELAFMQVSWSRMEIQNQSMIFIASLLANDLRAQVDQLNQTNTLLTFVLAGVIGAYILTNYFVTYRRTLRSLANLQAGTKIIGTGNLDYRFNDDRADEIGELARAFNRMTTNLREITASKDDLEREIDERKHVEAALAEYVDKLNHSNRELEQFAFIASHDLQEPLRKIRSFGNLLIKRMGNTLEEEPRGYLERMQNAAERMQKMIDDLLELSRVGTRPVNYEPVQLAEVVSEVLSDLETRIVTQQASVQVEALPELDADPLQMRQLMQNLIGNAIKYHKPGVAPLVRVWGTTAPHETNNTLMANIYVEDNGIGFNETYLEQIFQPFTRLHGRNEYEGTGIGLAICKKIVDRHQGSITAHSQPGQGATFAICLPVKQQK